MFINTQYFREAAIYYEKHGRYEDGVLDSYECIDYWTREHDRVMNGYSVGGVSITGQHYLYLNYLPILVNKEKITGEVKKQEQLFKAKRKADRGGGFVDFWDEDYILFWTWDIAKNGVKGNSPEERQANLKLIEQHLSIPIVKEDYNIVGGKNHLWLKPRGVGASWKGATIPIYNQFFVSDSMTFLLADESKFLTDEGLYSKFLYHKDTLMGNNKHGFRCAGFRRAFSKQDKNGMAFRASKVETQDIEGQKQIVEVGGKRSSVIGITINGDPNNARGKRGDFVYEEFGTFPKVASTWEINQSATEQDGLVFGTQYGFGTGGDEKSVNIKDLDTMFNDPVTYNILEFTNIYDEELYGMKSAYFTPAYRSLTYKDKDGNSNEAQGNAYLDYQEELKIKAADPIAITQFKAEHPRKPSDALSVIKGNIFPVKDIKAHRTYLTTSKLHRELVVTGRLKSDEYGVMKFHRTDEPPFEDYPIKSNRIYDSPVCVLHPPREIRGRVPQDMYRICLDPYRHDSSTGDSVGACYVIENPNRISPYRGDRIVAWYVGRPLEQDDFNKTVYSLAEYYNCKIGFENDEPGDVIGYGKREKLLHRLEPEFELAYDERIKTKSGSRKTYGMHIASGEENLRKLQGDKYIQEWLLRKVGETAEGKVLRNLHFIYDIGLLKELEKYPNGNFDRIAAIRIGVYYEKELIYNDRTVNSKRKTLDPIYERELF